MQTSRHKDLLLDSLWLFDPIWSSTSIFEECHKNKNIISLFLRLVLLKVSLDLEMIVVGSILPS